MRRVEPNESNNLKLFRDTVHGYIRIPKQYCKILIDTPEFQRLRRIEQTSMRPLYPCARHDRFSHSLGTYHLGSLALGNIERNALPKNAINDEEWKSLSKTFLIACLLHDIGHSPFSHTFEEHFDKKTGYLDKLLIKEATSLKNSYFKYNYKEKNNFKYDYEEKGKGAKEHEKLSALILLRRFSKDIKKFGAYPLIAARMIIGCQFSDRIKLSNFCSVANCLVNLLNGDGIDVDRLDYTSRDLWASGVETSTIDLPRLLSSLCIRKHKKTYKLLFLKNAISVIESVLDVRNFLHAWIFSHHKVVYDQYLLKKAIETLAINITESRYDFDKANGKEKKRIQKKALSKLFSVDSFFEPQKIGKEKYHLHLITDDDLIFLMKQDIKNNQRTSSDNYMHSWLYREHKLSPLWKSYPEFRAIFEDISNTKLKKFDAKVEYLVKNIIKPTGYNYKIEHVKPSYHEISDKDIIVVIDKKLVFFRDLRLPQRSKDNLCPFFYIYGDFNEKDRKELTKELIRLAKKV